MGGCRSSRDAPARNYSAIIALWCWMLREIFPISSRGWKPLRKGKVHDTISPFAQFNGKNLMRITSTTRFPSTRFLRGYLGQRSDDVSTSLPEHIAFAIKKWRLLGTSGYGYWREKRSLIMSTTRMASGDCNPQPTCTYTRVFEVKWSRWTRYERLLYELTS